jgi:hypothetical protein
MIQEINSTAEVRNKKDLKSLRNFSLFITIIASIDIFLFYINFDSEKGLYIGALTHLILLLLIAKQWGCMNSKRTAFYLCIVCNYLLIIPKYLYPKDYVLLDIFGNAIFFIPQFVIYYVFQDIKQITVLNINSLMVICLGHRGELIHCWGFDDPETIGVTTVLTFLNEAIAMIIYIILLQLKYHKLKN